MYLLEQGEVCAGCERDVEVDRQGALRRLRLHADRVNEGVDSRYRPELLRCFLCAFEERNKKRARMRVF